MEAYPQRIFVRMTDEGAAQAKSLAASLDMTLSDLVRVLLQSSGPSVDKKPDALIIVDRDTAVGLRRELRRWGYHYNQAVHALNAIAYYLRLNEMDFYEVMEELEKANRKLASMNDSVEALRSEVAEISTHPRAFM